MSDQLENEVSPIDLQELDPRSADARASRWSERKLALIKDVKVGISARLGATEIPVAKLFELRDGETVRLDNRVDEPIELLVEGKVVARGQIVVVGESFAVQISEILDAG
jgi:flagellar motor switch protein FliN/FliY